METEPEIGHSHSAPMHLSAIYVGKDSVGQACVLDLSMSSLHVLGTTPVRVGLTLAIRVSAPEGSFVHISMVTVHWPRGYEFGLQFERLPEHERRQLLLWIMALAEQSVALPAEPVA